MNSPVSITPDGRTLERSEVVEYLKTLSEHIVIQTQLEDEIRKLRKNLAEATKPQELDGLLPPEPMPPTEEKYPLITLIVLPVFAVLMLFNGNSVFERVVLPIVVFTLLFFSLKHHKNGNIKAQEDWEKRKVAYDREVARVQALNSSAKRGDSAEVVRIKKELREVEDAYQKIVASKNYQENRNILAQDYRSGIIPCILYYYFQNGRANTLSEAINLYHTEQYREDQARSQAELRQEVLMHQQALMLQQNLNAARLSEQIENAKDEIELQILLGDLFVADQINSLRRDLNY